MPLGICCSFECEQYSHYKTAPVGRFFRTENFYFFCSGLFTAIRARGVDKKAALRNLHRKEDYLSILFSLSESPNNLAIISIKINIPTVIKIVVLSISKILNNKKNDK